MRYLFFLLFLSSTIFSFSQESVIRCKVIDAQTFEPLESVIVKDSTNPNKITFSNKNGEFVVKSNNPSTYYISILGYETYVLRTNQQEHKYKILLMRI